ncbi:MAG TPA: exodeoxyribonuclease VII small subunit [Chloroflexia bacterium]|nr:exodeoxyribonuclease VII small subunit [Chloroflexia bacterium]
MDKSKSRSGAHAENSESFERNFQRLQEVVQRLSDGNLTLQDALSSFEEGMALADSCAKMLDEAELRVKQVSERAMRAGQAAVTELEGAARTNEAPAEEPELVTFEIESYETTLVFDAPEKRKGNNSMNSLTEPDKRRSSFLDPLFDEDD